MKGKKIKYNLYLIGQKEALRLTREEGQKLTMILMQQNQPRFFLVDNDVIAISSVSHLEEEIIEKDFCRSWDRQPYFDKYGNFDELVELTLSEIETQEKYQQMKKGLEKKFELKKLN